MSSALVGVVVTFYNEPGMFELCLKSLAAQGEPSIPIVIVDDAYPSAGIVEELCKLNKLNNVTIIRHEENRGVGAARNTGIRALKAEYAFIIDGDDYLPRGTLSAICTLLTANPDVDLLCCDYLVFDSDNVERLYLRRARVPEPGELLYRQPFLGAGIVMRRSLIMRAGMYDESVVLKRGMEDREFLIRLMVYEPKVLHTDRPLYARRLPRESRSVQCNWEQHRIRDYIVRKNEEVFADKRARRNFLSVGYVNSAEAYWGAGLVWMALKCYFDALRHDWRVVARRLLARMRACLAGSLRLAGR